MNMSKEFLRYLDGIKVYSPTKKGTSFQDLQKLKSTDVLSTSDGLVCTPVSSNNTQKPVLNLANTVTRGKKGKKSGKSVYSRKNLEHLFNDSLVAENYVTLDGSDPNHDEGSTDGETVFLEWYDTPGDSSVPEQSSPYSSYHYNMPKLDISSFLQLSLGAYEHFLVSKDPGTVDTVIECLQHAESPLFHDVFIEMSCRKSLDKTVREQAATSAMITTLVSEGIISTAQLERGMEKLLYASQDLSLDNPHAIEIILKYLEGCLSCRCLPHSFVCRIPEDILIYTTQLGIHGFPDLALRLPALRMYKERVAGMLEVYLDKNCLAGREAVADGLRGINEKFLLALAHENIYGQGCLEDRDVCKMRVEVPTHEFVRRALLMGMEGGAEGCGKICDLLTFLNSKESEYLVHDDDLRFGFWRMLEQLDNIAVDVPKVWTLASKLVLRGVAEELLCPSFVGICYRLRLGGVSTMQLMEAVATIMDSSFVASEQLHGIFREKRIPVYDEEGRMTMRIDKWKALSKGLVLPSSEEREFKTFLKEVIRDHFCSGLGDIRGLVKELQVWSVYPGSDYAAETVRKLAVFLMEMCGSNQTFQKIGIFRLSEVLKVLCEAHVLCRGDISAGLRQIYECLDDICLDLPEGRDMYFFLKEEWQAQGFLGDDNSKLPSSRSSMEDLPALQEQEENCYASTKAQVLHRWHSGMDGVGEKPHLPSCSTLASSSGSRLFGSNLVFSV